MDAVLRLHRMWLSTPSEGGQAELHGAPLNDEKFEGTDLRWLLATEGCLPTERGARVRRSSSKISVTDGPFTESKEVVGGFAILQAKSKEEAIELARQFLQIAGEGECELRQIYEPHGGEHDCPQSSERAEVALKA